MQGFIEMVSLVLMRNGIMFYGEIRIVPIHSLYLHEEILEQVLPFLIESIKRKGIFQDPIVVDRNSMVILDGMHRTEALKRLKYDYIVAYLVDYRNELIKVKRWCRVVDLPSIEKLNVFYEKVRKVIRELGLEAFACESKEAERKLNEREIYGYFLDSHNEFVTCITSHEEKLDIYQIYLALRRIEQIISRKYGLNIHYLPDGKIGLKDAAVNKVYLIPPTISKEEVIYYAKKQKVFPPKSTRHIIPLRPFFVNIPLRFLRKSKTIDLDKLNNIMNAILVQRRKLRLRGKIVIDRLYEDDYIDIFA